MVKGRHRVLKTAPKGVWVKMKELGHWALQRLYSIPSAIIMIATYSYYWCTQILGHPIFEHPSLIHTQIASNGIKWLKVRNWWNFAYPYSNGWSSFPWSTPTIKCGNQEWIWMDHVHRLCLLEDVLLPHANRVFFSGLRSLRWIQGCHIWCKHWIMAINFIWVSN